MANWLKYKQTYKLKVKCTDRRFSKVTMLHIMGWGYSINVMIGGSMSFTVNLHTYTVSIHC